MYCRNTERNKAGGGLGVNQYGFLSSKGGLTRQRHHLAAFELADLAAGREEGLATFKCFRNDESPGYFFFLALRSKVSIKID